MNGRILKFEGPVHVEADRLLPWYVNGTLERDERVQVEQHLIECPACQSEVAWLRSVQETFAEQAEKDDVSPRMQHLHRRMRTRRKAPVVSAWRRRETWLAWLAAIQAAVILGLGGLLFHQQHVAYHTLSAPSDRGALLAVVFDPHIHEAQMRQLVLASGARIVGGPTEGGAYLLRTSDARSAAVRQMLAHSPQVTLVEDLSTGGNP